MNVRQLPLDLAHAPHYSRVDFLIAEANRDAVAFVDRFPETPGTGLALWGPAGCGKTHLTHVWAERVGARFLAAAGLTDTLAALSERPGDALAFDDANRVAGDDEAERALFHLLNLTREKGGALLLAAREPPARWPVRLPDLRSRLAALPAVSIGAPDDALLGAVLVKLFADRQLSVGEDVVAYLLGRMERSLAAARRIVERLDALGLAAKRPVTVPLAAQALAMDNQGEEFR